MGVTGGGGRKDHPFISSWQQKAGKKDLPISHQNPNRGGPGDPVGFDAAAEGGEWVLLGSSAP